jgi:hypothetical protein
MTQKGGGGRENNSQYSLLCIPGKVYVVKCKYCSTRLTRGEGECVNAYFAVFKGGIH